MIYNVRDYGAVGNGSTNDRSAIQAAINAAHAAGGGEVYIPRGTYIVTGGSEPSDGAIMMKNNVTVFGDGMGETIIKLRNDWDKGVTGIFRTAYGVENHDLGLHDLTIDGNRANNSGKVDGWFNGVRPGHPGTDTDITLNRVEIKNCSGYGFDPHEQTTNLVITNSISHHNGLDGFTLDFQINGYVANNIAYSNDRHGFNICTSTRDTVLVDNIAYDNGSSGITIQRGSEDIPLPRNIRIEGGEIYSNNINGIFINKADRITIDGVEIHDNGQRGIRITGSEGTIVQNSNIHDNSQSQDGKYEEIGIASYDDRNGAAGIIYYTTDTQIVNNVIANSSTTRALYSVREYADGTDYTSVIGNDISGARNPVLLSGDHSTYSETGNQTGTSGNDNLTGTDGVDEIHALAGNDTVRGRGGNDSLYGEDGDDQLYGDIGDDYLKGGSGKDTLYGGDGNDRLYGDSKDDFLYGGSGNDYFNGGGGNDRLEGGSGNDTLIGEAGNDILIGEAGADKFQFKDQFGIDQILDFTQGEDRLNISRMLADNFSEFQQHVSVQSGKTVVTFDVNRIELIGFTTALQESDVTFYG